MTGGDPHVLVVAKAPVPGLAKTRLGQQVGMTRAADLAAAALLDTLDACVEAFGPGHRHVAMTGDLAAAVRRDELDAALHGWRVFEQRGTTFGERLAHAHADLGAAPVVQIGMDTPHVTGDLLSSAGALLDDHDAVLGPAEDGGWWLLALRDPAAAVVLRHVPMSTPETAALTRAALEAGGLDVGETVARRDVDEVADAGVVAAGARHTRFAAAWLVADLAVR